MKIVPNYSAIRQKVVTVVGIGGVGSVVAQMLTRLGLRKLILFDYDMVELANMNRMFYLPSHVGLSKVEAARNSLNQINPDVQIIAHNVDITLASSGYRILQEEVNNCNLVLCCVDNYSARMTVNKLCNLSKKTWIQSGVSQNAIQGHIQLIIPGETACFACAPPTVVVDQAGDQKKIKREGVCAASLPTTMAIIAGMMSQMTLKLLLDFGCVDEVVHAYNGLTDFFHSYSLLPNKECVDDRCKQLQKEFQLSVSFLIMQIDIKQRKATTLKERWQRINQASAKQQQDKCDTKLIINQWGITLQNEEDLTLDSAQQQIGTKNNQSVLQNNSSSVLDLQRELQNIQLK